MDNLTKAQRSLLMGRVRQRGTALEIQLRSELRACGARYRTNVRLPGTPDIAFPVARIAVFVDGCFWHGCPAHGTMPSTNRTFWQNKIRRNRKRDREVKTALHRLGWIAVRVWEHDVKKHADRVARKLLRTLERRTAAGKGRG